MNSQFCEQPDTLSCSPSDTTQVQPTQVPTLGVKKNCDTGPIKADHVDAMLMCHTHYTLTQRVTPGLIDNMIAK